MWEYKLVYVKYRLFEQLINELNKYGAENWEIIHYQEEKPKNYDNEFEAKILFKRVKEIPV